MFRIKILEKGEDIVVQKGHTEFGSHFELPGHDVFVLGSAGSRQFLLMNQPLRNIQLLHFKSSQTLLLQKKIQLKLASTKICCQRKSFSNKVMQKQRTFTKKTVCP